MYFERIGVGLKGGRETLHHVLERTPETFDRFLTKEYVAWRQEIEEAQRLATIEDSDDDSISRQEQPGRSPAEFIIGATSDEEEMEQEQIENDFGDGSIYPDNVNQEDPSLMPSPRHRPDTPEEDRIQSIINDDLQG